MAIDPNWADVWAGRIADVRLVKNRMSMLDANAPSDAEPDASYYALRVQMPDGREEHLLLTAMELARAIKRARDNEEDVPRVNPIRDALD